MSLNHEIGVYVIIKDIEKQITNMPMKHATLKKTAYILAKLTNRITQTLNKKSTNFQGKIKRVDRFDKRADTLWEQASTGYNFSVQRNMEYLNWRYADPRNGDYQIWIAEEQNQLKGYCVVYINTYKPEYPVAYLMDLFCMPDSDDVMKALLGEALRFFNEHDCNIITALAVNGGKKAASLDQMGFLNSREKLNIFFGRHGLRAQDPKLKELLENSSPQNIHFSYGDIDSLPVNLPYN